MFLEKCPPTPAQLGVPENWLPAMAMIKIVTRNAFQVDSFAVRVFSSKTGGTNHLDKTLDMCVPSPPYILHRFQLPAPGNTRLLVQMGQDSHDGRTTTRYGDNR